MWLMPCKIVFNRQEEELLQVAVALFIVDVSCMIFYIYYAYSVVILDFVILFFIKIMLGLGEKGPSIKCNYKIKVRVYLNYYRYRLCSSVLFLVLIIKGCPLCRLTEAYSYDKGCSGKIGNDKGMNSVTRKPMFDWRAEILILINMNVFFNFLSR